MKEEDSVKSRNAAREVELQIFSSKIPYTFLRPQYLYGGKCSKRYLDFFIGRASRKLPIPVPHNGDQLVCLTHIEDLSSLITASVSNLNAYNQIFNVGSDRYISYKGLCSAIQSNLKFDANELKYLNYDPDLFLNWDGKNDVSEFPFRKETFITSVDKIKQLLNWVPMHNILTDLQVEVDEYLSSNRAKEVWDHKQLQYDQEIIDQV